MSRIILVYIIPLILTYSLLSKSIGWRALFWVLGFVLAIAGLRVVGTLIFFQEWLSWSALW